MQQNTLRKDNLSSQEWRDTASQALKKSNSSHPALKRLRRGMIASDETGLVITSYDRMHHRHNRS